MAKKYIFLSAVVIIFIAYGTGALFSNKSWAIDTTQCPMVYDPTNPCVSKESCVLMENNFAKIFKNQYRTKSECEIALVQQERVILKVWTIQPKPIFCFVSPCPELNGCFLIPISEISDRQSFTSFNECFKVLCNRYPTTSGC